MINLPFQNTKFYKTFSYYGIDFKENNLLIIQKPWKRLGQWIVWEDRNPLDLPGVIIKQARKERHLTQSQVGELIGVQKSQISRIVRNAKNVTIKTILRVFRALKAKVNFNV